MAGDTLELTILHPTVGSRTFAAKAGEDVTMDLGGYTSERMKNGNLSGHKSLTAKPWEIAGISLEALPGDGSLEFLQDVQDSPEDAEIEWTHINGHVYKGTGSLEADVKASTKDGYVPVTLTGDNKLELIV